MELDTFSFSFTETFIRIKQSSTSPSVTNFMRQRGLVSL
jgi:hypothetical protein